MRWGNDSRPVACLYTQRGAPAHVDPAVHNTSTVRDAAGQRGRKGTGASVGGWAAGVGPRRSNESAKTRSLEARLMARERENPDVHRHLSSYGRGGRVSRRISISVIAPFSCLVLPCPSILQSSRLGRVQSHVASETRSGSTYDSEGMPCLASGAWGL
jgi:hypothetical protein